MDANGTRLHLLLGPDDWARCLVGESTLRELWDQGPDQDPSGLKWDDDRGELTLQPLLLKFVASERDTRPSIDNRRGAGRDRFGNWYWIDESKLKIRVRSSGTGHTSDFWSAAIQATSQQRKRAGDFQSQEGASQQLAVLKLSGLAVTEDHYLVVGVTQPKGLLIFDLHAVREPRHLIWPAEIPFQPFDIAPRPDGGVWILDRWKHCYWALDRHFNVVGPKRETDTLTAEREDDFQPLDNSPGADNTRGTSRRVFPTNVAFNLASPLSVQDPIAIESLPDGTVLILDYAPGEKFSSIFRYDFEEGKQLDGPVSTKAMKASIEEDEEHPFKLIGYDIAFVQEHDKGGTMIPDRLYVADADGNQAYAFNVCLRNESLHLEPVREYLPMRLFGGKGIVATDNSVYYDFAESWLPLVKQVRPRYQSEATFLTPILDGKDPDCVWHRLMLDACIPPETSVTVSSRSANNKTDLPFTEWRSEPKFYLRSGGSELPFMSGVKRNGNGSAADSKRGDGTWELLFQKARGRFLQLRIKLSGNERATPHLRALRAYYPRFSYLDHYLPSVYREDEQSASFLDRFLANLEGLYTSLEDKVAAVQMLFDLRSAPAEGLEWLAGWFGIALDPVWDETKRRIFIKHAMDFFQFRGTVHGLKMALHLALDPCADESIFSLPSVGQKATHTIRIVEKFLTRVTPGVVAGDPTEVGTETVVSQTNRWRPDQGRSILIQRYTDFINVTAEIKQTSVEYPIIPPSDLVELERWRQFSFGVLGFLPAASFSELSRWRSFLAGQHRTAASDAELPRDHPVDETTRGDWTGFVHQANPSSIATERRLWQDFLARRYRRVNALNSAYGTHWPSFEDVSLPSKLPTNQAGLQDWYQFESVVLAMRRTAHKFSVLLPTPKSAAFNLSEHQGRIDLTRRIVNLEKPAHTIFDVKFYWALFRIGEARLGEDTLLDVGSRAPQLMPNLILGQEYIGESYLSPNPPQDDNNRFILGRDPLGNQM